jgi:ribosomal protein S27AE
MKQITEEVICPKCKIFQLHIVHKDTYECTKCHNIQPKNTALTREETSW